jgi:hypothetical protein
MGKLFDFKVVRRPTGSKAYRIATIIGPLALIVFLVISLIYKNIFWNGTILKLLPYGLIWSTIGFIAVIFVAYDGYYKNKRKSLFAIGIIALFATFVLQIYSEYIVNKLLFSATFLIFLIGMGLVSFSTEK